MKLIFDENLAARLAHRFADLFPGSTDVTSAGLDSTSDTEIWEFAKAHDYVIVSKDKDFESLSVVKGAPPKVILVQLGNCSVQQIENCLRRNAVLIGDFVAHSTKGLLVIRS